MAEEKKERMEQVGMTWRIPIDMKQKLIDTFGNASGKDVSETVLGTYFTRYPEALKKISDLEKEVQELKDHPVSGVSESLFAEKQHKCEILAEKVDSLEKQIEDQTRALQYKEEELTSVNSLVSRLQSDLEKTTNELETATAEDQSKLIISVDNEIIRNFLFAVKEHLEKRYHREVSFYEIFVKTTILYNVEKRCDWFYPPLKDDKIHEITGKTVKEWEKFLNQKEK
jgi:Skp family chaperone for outer membrane proteins